jgi:hypothetical protein
LTQQVTLCRKWHPPLQGECTFNGFRSSRNSACKRVATLPYVPMTMAIF